MPYNIYKDGHKKLSTKEILDALGGRLALAEDDNLHGYFTVRLTGVQRESSVDEVIPKHVINLKLKEPERFLDSLCKKVNRHAILIRAMTEKERELVGVDDFHYVVDHSMCWSESMIFGTIDALEMDNKFVPRKNGRKWIISIEPVILMDYEIPVREGEEVWKGGDSPYPERGRSSDLNKGKYDTLMFNEVWYEPRPSLLLEEGEKPDLEKHFERKSWYRFVAYTSAGNGNAKYLDTESHVNNDILGYRSGFHNHAMYNGIEYDSYTPGERIYY